MKCGKKSEKYVFIFTRLCLFTHICLSVDERKNRSEFLKINNKSKDLETEREATLSGFNEEEEEE